MITIKECITDLEKEIYIRSLISVAKIDGLVEPEIVFIDFQAGLIDQDSSSLWKETCNVTDIDFSNVSETTKRVILRDSIVIAHIDNDFSAMEETIIHELATLMSLPDELIDKIETWLLDYWSILQQGNELLAIPEA
jgi:tellurite resistance protein